MRIPSAAAALLGLAVGLAACTSGGGTPTPAPATPAATTPAATATPAPASEAPSVTPAAATDAPPTVAVSDTDLGSILTGNDGLTLYVFLPDKAGEPTCYDGCATAWPPLVIEGAPTVGPGIAAGDAGTVNRTDGQAQVTFDGWPLYFFAGDTSPGDANGQGLNGNWYVIGPDGTVIGAPAASEDELQY